MENNYKEDEMERIIEKQLRQGKTNKEIIEATGKSERYVSAIKKGLIQKGKITEDEIKQAKFRKTRSFLMTDPKMQKIMKYVKAGLSQTDIAQLVGCTQYIVGYNIKKFIRYGLITQEEVNKARQEYLKELKYDNIRREEVLEELKKGRLKQHFAPELGLTAAGARVIQDSLIEEGRITEGEIADAVATKGKEAQRKNEVIKLLKQGYMYREVTEAIGYCQQKVKKIKEEAISEGKLTEEEYQSARKERRAKLKKEPSKAVEDNEQVVQQVLELLKTGKTMYFMRKKTGQARVNIQAIIKKLIKEGKITQSEIDEFKDVAIKDVERKVLIGLRRGYSQREIVGMFEEGEYSLKYIQGIIAKLKERGDITSEEIEKYKYEAEQGEKELNEFVLRGIKQGLSRVAMTQLDENGYFTESMIRHAIKKMKEQGILSEKAIQQGRRVRKKSNQKKAEKARNKKDKQIVKLLLQGFTEREIGEQLGYLENTIQQNLVRIKKEGKITEEELKNARKQRKEEEKQKRKMAEEKQKEEKQETSNKQKKEDEKDCKEYKKNFAIALKITKTDDKYTDKQINALIQKLVSLAGKMQLLGILKNDELKIISRALFQAEKVEINNVLGIARLYLRMKNYQASIYTLNYSKDFLEKEEDLKKVAEALKIIGIHKRKIEAAQMLEQGYGIEAIQQRTQLNLVDLIELKKRKQQKSLNDKKSTETQGDEEFPDL